jgi:hypothetical protein
MAMRSQTCLTSAARDDMKNGTATIAHIGQQFIERFLHEGIETLRGFVENQQERVGLKRLDQAELSFHASAVFAQLSRDRSLSSSARSGCFDAP